MNQRYTVILERQPDGGYHVFCPALSGCRSEDDTLDEALDNIREAMGIYIESLKTHGEVVPTEDLLIKPMEIVV